MCKDIDIHTGNHRSRACGEASATSWMALPLPCVTLFSLLAPVVTLNGLLHTLPQKKQLFFGFAGNITHPSKAGNTYHWVVTGAVCTCAPNGIGPVLVVTLSAVVSLRWLCKGHASASCCNQQQLLCILNMLLAWFGFSHDTSHKLLAISTRSR